MNGLKDFLVEKRNDKGINRHTVWEYEYQGRRLCIDRNHDVGGNQYYLYEDGKGGEGCGTIWYEDLRAARNELKRLFMTGEPVKRGQDMVGWKGEQCCLGCRSHYSVDDPEYEKCWSDCNCRYEKKKHAKRAASGREVLKQWAKVNRLLDEKRGDKDSRKIGNNTYLKRRGSGIAVLLHNTDILLYTEGKSIILDSGGWKTPTTKDRMNEWLPMGYGISQAKGVWFLHTPTRGTFIYQDGMRIGPYGAIYGDGKQKEYKRVQKETKAIQAYAKAFAAKMVKGEIPPPDAGDCWYCLMRDKEGKSLGELSRDKGHIREHIKEKYYVPSLLRNAMEKVPTSIYTGHQIYGIWRGEDRFAASRDKYLEQEITRILVKYLKRELNIAGVHG